MFKGLRLSRPDSPVGQTTFLGHWPDPVDAPVTISIRSLTSSFKCQSFSTVVRPHQGLAHAPAVAHHDPRTIPCGHPQHLSHRGRAASRQNPETHRVPSDFRMPRSPRSRRCGRSRDRRHSRAVSGSPRQAALPTAALRVSAGLCSCA